MPQYVFKVTLFLQAPILSQATGGRKHGIDTITVFNDENKPSLLGSSIRGNLREVWEYFVAKQLTDKLTSTQINVWLGQESLQKSQNMPQRACLSFDYYWQAEAEKKQSVRHRIKIDQETGTVEPGALQVIESPYITGEKVAFEGRIYALLQNDEEKNNVLHWLHKGLGYIQALGAFRGVGFGKVVQVEIVEEKATIKSKSLMPLTQTRFGIALSFDRPFCFARHHNQRHHNHFAAEVFVPGAAIIAALARQVEENSILKEHLDKIQISHAFPAKVGEIKRSLAIPYSLVSVNKQLYDVSLKKNSGLIQQCAPNFVPDWKGEVWAQAEALCGHCQPNRSVHIHNAIDNQTGSAQKGALFSMEVIHPKGYQWLTNVNCQRVPKEAQEKVLQELYVLLTNGLHHLGKTKATATIENHQSYEYTVAVNQLPQKETDIFVLMLQTPALLLPNFDNIPSTNGDQVLLQRYHEVWDEFAQGHFTLSHFYARQAMVGGDYLQTRFWSKRETYMPEILTLAGSVFIFEVNRLSETCALLKQWIAQGLPQHSKTQGGENWQQNPYIATNGYGEIVINPKLQTNSLKGVWHEL